jgi:FkbM family methyltransferase
MDFDRGTDLEDMTMLRLLAERLSRNIVLRRRLPQDLGGRTIYVTPDSALRFWSPDLKRADSGQLMNLARRFVPKDSVVWDVGANVGLFAFSAAAKAKLVCAFEPDPWLASLCQRTASSIRNVHVLSAAVTNAVSIGELQIARRGRAANFIAGFGTTQTGGVRDAQLVVTVTLDWLAERFPVPDIMKIDVEAGERSVFEGGKALFARARPLLICEVASKNSSWVTEFLIASGYSFLDERMSPTSVAVGDIVAVPSSS